MSVRTGSLTLTVEGEAADGAPSEDVIRSAVERMTPVGGPSFLILEDRGRDYVQAAGGDGVFTAEWREYQGGAFRHWKAGLIGPPSTGEVSVPTGGSEVRVRPNERLTAADVVTILTAFGDGRNRPAGYVWRDMTDMFA